MVYAPAGTAVPASLVMFHIVSMAEPEPVNVATSLPLESCTRICHEPAAIMPATMCTLPLAATVRGVGTVTAGFTRPAPMSVKTSCRSCGSVAYAAFPGQLVWSASRWPEMTLNETFVPAR